MYYSLVSYFSYDPTLRILFFFFNKTASTDIYTLSLHDALPICVSRLIRSIAFTSSTRRQLAVRLRKAVDELRPIEQEIARLQRQVEADRKSTRLNSSHVEISYAVFCLKKKIDI